MPPDHPVFRQTAQLAEPSIFLCRRPWDAKAERYRTAITVDEVRALKSFFQMSSASEGWRVALVDPTDDLTQAAANALLKILEEPPARSALILICHRPALLLPTLRSRCRELRCQRLEADQVARALQDGGTEVPAADAGPLAALADGSVGRAFELHLNDGVALYGRIVDLLAGMPGLDRGKAVKLAEEAAARDDGVRFRLTVDLAELALSRLARKAADPASAPASLGGEKELHGRMARTREQARIWAEAGPRLRYRAETARQVNLDPAQIILDMFLQIDIAASEAARNAP
jgi:DNA polymerase-3 subunit delta'